MKLTIPEEEIMSPGHLACLGCGATLALRYVLKALGKRTVMTIPACCCTVIDGPFPFSSYGVPIMHTAFETAASAASGILAGLEMTGNKNINVLAWAGDGGTFDIGIQALSGAAERGDNILYVCYDNEAYMNTGIQRSSATPWGAWTTTTPEKHPKDRPKKDIIAIMAAHRIPYAATASIAYPEDLIKKVQKAKDKKGTKFLHIFASCPTGWKMRPEDSIKVARLAVETKVFPLYEVENGEVWRITRKPKGLPIIEYLKIQGRFRHLKEADIRRIQENVDKEWDRLMKLASDTIK
ncbi:MAG TPA: 3-methyl-2-oxobutanoate dehydrogenase subunit beta [bacterium (Candidatus Stahlbacteria)]|nr:3-methyl-2-oxobutanoate dehydrogenase subunit beta [Candidatus Stahlbacteria bacterium]